MPREEHTSLKASSFSFAFLSFYLLLLFLVENTFIYWVAPVISVLYLALLANRFWKYPGKISQFNVLCGISVCIYLLLLLSLTPLSLNIPLSVHRWVSISLGGITFVTFFTAPNFKQSMTRSLLIGIVFIHLLFVPLSFLFSVFKGLGQILPTNSLLTYLVGHNHAYILYLYSLPIAAYYWVQSKYQKAWGLANFLFILGILFSFSRFGLALLVVEIILFLIWFSQQKKRQKYISTILTGLLFITVSYGVALFVFSSISSLSEGEKCRVPFLQKQLCKSFVSDGRVFYWSQAWQGFRDQPIRGNGGGTFRIISTKYRQQTYQFSSFAHNEYLQLLSEFGLIGAVAIAGYGALLFLMFKKWSQSSGLSRVLLISITVASVDAMVNFNWNYSAIFTLHCLLVALAWREIQNSNDVSKQQRKPSFLLVGIMFTLLSFSLLLIWWLSGRYIAAELFAKNNTEKYFQIFPYEAKNVREVIAITSDPSLREKAIQLVATDPETDQVLLKQNFDPLQRYELYQQLVTHDPLDLDVRVKLISLAIYFDQPEVVHTHLQWLIDYYPAYQKHEIKTADPVYLEKTIEYANQLAQRDPRLAAEITATVYQFEPWRANEITTTFLLYPEKYSASDIEKIVNVLPKDIWRYREPLSNWAVNQAIFAAEQENWLVMNKYIELSLSLSDGEMWNLWDRLNLTFSQKLQRLSLRDPEQTAQRKELIMFWRQGLASIQKFDTVGLATQEWSKQIDAFVE